MSTTSVLNVNSMWLLLLFSFVREFHLVRFICVCTIMMIMVRARRWSVCHTWNQLNTPTQHQPKKSAICHRIFVTQPAHRTVGRTCILALRNEKPRRRKKTNRCDQRMARYHFIELWTKWPAEKERKKTNSIHRMWRTSNFICDLFAVWVCFIF